MYILQLFDNYAATYSLLVIGLVESLALAWVYGELTGKKSWKGGKGEVSPWPFDKNNGLYKQCNTFITLAGINFKFVF